MKLYGVLDWSLTLRIQHNIFDEEPLLHFGIPGMKWGVRRARRTPSQSTVKKKKKGIDERERELQYIKEFKNRDKMSTRQLQARVNRIRAEKEFERLAFEKENARKKAEIELKSAKRKSRAEAFAIAMEVAGKIDIKDDSIRKALKFNPENFKKPGMSDEDAKKAMQDAEEGIITLVKTAKSVAPSIGKLAKAKAGLKVEEEKINQSGLTEVYIPGFTNSELLHYGIPGMKWGQRRNHARRATKDLRRDFKQKKTEYKVSKDRVSLNKGHIRRLNSDVFIDGRVSSTIDYRGNRRALKRELKLNKKEMSVRKQKMKDTKKLYKKAYKEVYNTYI